ncbi:FAD-dependent oxidoreductase [Thermococcus sp. SY098]|nr:FAD-dependent oxidoreductase [Thermococcus sp. SY098]WRS53498.1 FAD-dependent oxidoreductase [Thermococcus sp. SY098]
MDKYDFLIIGGGAAGFAAALKANELGVKTLMVNRGPIGGHA